MVSVFTLQSLGIKSILAAAVRFFALSLLVVSTSKAGGTKAAVIWPAGLCGCYF